MNLDYKAERTWDIFGPARDEFASLIFELHSERTTQLEHGQIEVLISQGGDRDTEDLEARHHLYVSGLRESRGYDLTGPRWQQTS